MTTKTMAPFAVDAPCTQSWDAMRDDGSARFCASCREHVVDLAAMSEREIGTLLSITGGAFCARQTLVDGRLVTRSEPSGDRRAQVAQRLPNHLEAPRPAKTRLERFVVRTVLGQSLRDLRVVLAAGAITMAYSLPAAAQSRIPDATSSASGTTADSNTDGIVATQPEPKRERLLGKIAPRAPRFDRNILFAPGSSSIKASGEAILNDVARVLQSHRWVRGILVHGSTSDNEGTLAEQQVLGQARAQAVRDRLASLGVEPERLGIDPVTQTQTPDSEASETVRAQQRSVSLSVFGDESSP